MKRTFATVALAVVLGCTPTTQIPAQSTDAGASPSSVTALARTGASRVTRLQIDKVESPAFEGRTFGDIGQYEKLVGRAFGVVEPTDPIDAGIVNVAGAPKNGQGLVEYDVDVYILKPINMDKGNRSLFYDVVNRGNKNLVTTFNIGAANANNPMKASDAGDGLLMNMGFAAVWSGWQADVLTGSDRMQARFPVATNTDGTPIHRKIDMELVFEQPAFTVPVSWDRGADVKPYPAYEPAMSSATLSRRFGADGESVPIARDQWSFDKCPDGKAKTPSTVDICYAAGFSTDLVYDLVYEARDPAVMGLAFAATRDIVSFLRYQTQDSTGTPNPLAAAGLPPIARSAGVSQSGRWLRDFIFQGVNEDEQGSQVFEGANPIIAGSRKTFTNFAFAQPGRFSRQHEDHVFPNDQFPFTYTMLTDPLTARTDSILRRCEATSTCPKIFHIDSDFEIWGARGALITTSPTGQPILLPDNVRAYLFSSTQHGVGNATFGICQQLSNPLAYSSLPALTADLDDWVTTGQAPPPSRYPTLADGMLVPIDQTGFPDIPGVNHPGNYNVLRVADYSVQPPLEGEAYPVFVTPVDTDGNSVAGIRHPLLEVPIATYTGFNLRAAGHAPNEACSTTGSYIPFARTLADR